MFYCLMICKPVSLTDIFVITRAHENTFVIVNNNVKLQLKQTVSMN